jgi:hypothetical protein
MHYSVLHLRALSMPYRQGECSQNLPWSVPVHVDDLLGGNGEAVPGIQSVNPTLGGSAGWSVQWQPAMALRFGSVFVR